MNTNTASSDRHSRRYASSAQDVEEELRSVHARIASTIEQLHEHVRDRRHDLVCETLDAMRNSKLSEGYSKIQRRVQQSLKVLRRHKCYLEQLDLRYPRDFRDFFQYQDRTESAVEEGVQSARSRESFKQRLAYTPEWGQVVTVATKAHLADLNAARRTLDAQYYDLVAIDPSHRTTAASQSLYRLRNQYQSLQDHVEDEHTWWKHHCFKSPQHQVIMSDMHKLFQRLGRRVERCAVGGQEDRAVQADGVARHHLGHHRPVAHHRRSLSQDLPTQGLGAIARWLGRELSNLFDSCF